MRIVLLAVACFFLIVVEPLLTALLARSPDDGVSFSMPGSCLMNRPNRKPEDVHLTLLPTSGKLQSEDRIRLFGSQSCRINIYEVIDAFYYRQHRCSSNKLSVPVSITLVKKPMTLCFLSYAWESFPPMVLDIILSPENNMKRFLKVILLDE